MEKALSLLSYTRVVHDASFSPRWWDEAEGGAITSMLDGSIKPPFKSKTRHFVHRIETPEGRAYLKRTAYQPPRNVLRQLLRSGRAHSDAGWEYLAVRALQAHGFRVMQPIVFGEQCWLGFWPRRGFLLAREVAGEELAKLADAKSDPASRCAAFRAAGNYVGRLHGSGFYHAPRFHDFLYERAPDGSLQLTMIDADFKGMAPEPRPFDAGEALDALAHSCYLFLRGDRLKPVEIRCFLRGYRAGLCSRGHDFSPRDLPVVIKAVIRRLREHAQDPTLRAMFPGTPPPPEPEAT
jgi:hypothetical protein